jgi:capsular exopolysaccharide synthesis family protein
MNTEPNFHQFSSKKYGKLSQDLPSSSPGKSDEEEEKLDLGWVFAVAFRRLPIMVAVAIILIGLLGSLIVSKSRKVVPEYQGGFDLLIEPVTVEGQFSRKYLSAQASGADINKANVNNNLVDYETLIRVLKSPQMMDSVIERLKTRYPHKSWGQLNSGLEISRVMYLKDGKEEGTKIVKVVYRDLDAEKIQFILDTLAEAYLEYSLEERQISIDQGIKFIEEQLPTLESRFKKIQKKRQEFRSDAQIIDVNTTNVQLSTKLRLIESEILSLRVELSEKQLFYQSLLQNFKEENYGKILASKSEVYNWLLRQYYDLESKVAVESARLVEDSLPMQNLLEKQQKMRLLLRQEAERVTSSVLEEVKTLESTMEIVENAEETVKRQLQELPAIASQDNELEQELEVVGATLNDFLKKREALQIDRAQQQVPWKLISLPKVRRDAQGNPISLTVTSTKRQLAIAAILSILLSIGVGFIVEVLIQVFHTPEEIKAATKLPVLGVIPLTKELKQVAKKPSELIRITAMAGFNRQGDSKEEEGKINSYRNEVGSSVSEAFRYLYTNICLSGFERSIHSLAICSATSGDGKSTVAVNLALTSAAIGQRVLLVDANLRNPKIHVKLGLPNLRGLSDTITTDLSLNDAIQRSPIEENLFVLTAGHVPLDPIKVLSSKKRQYLMEQFEAFFDLVIYDTPAIMNYADASIIAGHTDASAVVVSIEKTNRSLAVKALEEFQISGASVLGVVANQVKR